MGERKRKKKKRKGQGETTQQAGVLLPAMHTGVKHSARSQRGRDRCSCMLTMATSVIRRSLWRNGFLPLFISGRWVSCGKNVSTWAWGLGYPLYKCVQQHQTAKSRCNGKRLITNRHTEMLVSGDHLPPSRCLHQVYFLCHLKNWKTGKKDKCKRQQQGK